MKTYDAIIIGFGKGGKTLAAELAKRGQSVAMIEKSNKMYGGTCINVGCIPSKSLIIQAGQSDYAQAVKNKEALVAKLRQKNFDKLNQLDNITIYTAKATFKNSHEVHIQNEEMEDTIYGERIFINTGAVPVIPNIEGILDTRYIYTSAEMMSLEKLPKRLAIIGGGYIGLEFSSMYARYQSEVTVFEFGSRLVQREDEDIAQEIQKVLENQGVRFHFNASVTRVENIDETVRITYQDQQGNKREETFDGVLLATGRKANTHDLGLENTHIQLDPRGNIIVNEHLQTHEKHIYAMGDVKGGLQFTYISLDDYRIVKDHLFGEGKRTTNNRGNVAYSVFISPTFSRVGLSQQEAIEAGYDIKIAHLPAAAIPRANVISQPNGVLKAIIDKNSDKILGCVLFCAESEEMINFVALAMDLGLPYQQVRDHIFTHPTMSEALNDLFTI